MSFQSRSIEGPLYPIVSVVMSVYNGLPYLEEAVQSILEQTFEDFELIIINDGSADGSKALLEHLAGSDDRIRLLHQENQGLIASLNRGVDIARGKYIARMDADDISYPERLERQVDFLNNQPDVGILGTQVETIDTNGTVQKQFSFPTDPAVVAWRLMFECCLTHPSIMMRRSLASGLNGYAEDALHAEDYELYTRALLCTNIVNLPDTLHQLRRWDGTITATKRDIQIWTCCRVAASLHTKILDETINESIAHFLTWHSHETVERALHETDADNMAEVHAYLRALYNAFVRRFLPDGPNIRVRQRALYQLDQIADIITDKQGWSEGILHKLKSRYMAPHEIGPWMWNAIQCRVD